MDTFGLLQFWVDITMDLNLSLLTATVATQQLASNSHDSMIRLDYCIWTNMYSNDCICIYQNKQI